MLPGSYWPNRPKFYDPAKFPWLQPLVDAWPQILAEYEAVRNESHPWPERNLFKRTDAETKEVEKGEGWNVFGLYAFNRKKTENCEKCPLTHSLLQALPYKVTTAAFSILVPGAHIIPHSGYIGYSDRVLRCHLGLKVPKEAAVGKEYAPKPWVKEDDDETRQGIGLRADNEYWGWNEGSLLVFDDTHVHEAWNSTAEERVILLLDFERPDEYMPPKECIDELLAKANTDPFKIGNLGDIYLDRLTGDHGWEK